MNIFLGKHVGVIKTMHENIGIDLVITEVRPDVLAVENICGQLKIELLVKEQNQKLDSMMPDAASLVVIASFSTILKQALIDQCRTIINFHGGLLPQCRGRHPLPSAILNKHVMMGVTCHIIDSEEIDLGPIVARIALPLDYSADFASNDQRLSTCFSNIASIVFKSYKTDGRLISQRMELEGSTYFPPVGKKEMRKLMRAQSLQDYFSS